jgi:endoglucanase
MAMAARVYSRVDQGFAAGCLKASEAAWSWLRKNPFRGGFKNPPGIRTGEYGDENVADEQYWAAAELYRTTGEEEYQDYVESVVAEGRTDLVELGWQSVGGFGSIAYMLTDKGKRDDAVARRIQARFLAFCDAHVGVMEKDGYRITLLPGEYCWGSNMTLLNDAMHLIIADRLAPNARYVEAARDDLHYLLGRNALNQSYLTGFGSNPVRNPHHRPSVADGVKDPVPGLVSGGPDEYLEDPYAKSNLQNLPPAKCFKDDSSTYSTNEVAIYWNTPAVFVMARFSAREGRECEETEDCEQTP